MELLFNLFKYRGASEVSNHLSLNRSISRRLLCSGFLGSNSSLLTTGGPMFSPIVLTANSERSLKWVIQDFRNNHSKSLSRCSPVTQRSKIHTNFHWYWAVNQKEANIKLMLISHQEREIQPQSLHFHNPLDFQMYKEDNRYMQNWSCFFCIKTNWC